MYINHNIMSNPRVGTLRFLNLKALQITVKNREDEYSRRSNFLEYFNELVTVNKLRRACIISILIPFLLD